jgi:hypothetical protein
MELAERHSMVPMRAETKRRFVCHLWYILLSTIISSGQEYAPKSSYKETIKMWGNVAKPRQKNKVNCGLPESVGGWSQINAGE